MIERDEELLDRLLRLVPRREPGKKPRVGCPQEENLAAYLDGGLTENDRSELEGHLAKCSLCLDELLAAHGVAQDGHGETVPQRVLEKAMALIPEKRAAPDFLVLIVRLVRDSLELVTTSGELANTAAPAAIRGKGKPPAGGMLQVAKELENFRMTVEVERLEGDLCQVVVKATPKAGSVADGLRFSLLSRGREQASYMARQGSAIFERIVPGDYQLAVAESGNCLGTIKLTIKEGSRE